MKIKYLIFSKGDTKKEFEVEKNFKELKIAKKDYTKENYDSIDNLIDKINSLSTLSLADGYSHIILLNDSDLLSKESINLFTEYSKEKQSALFMPIIHVKDIDESGNIQPKGFFNSCLWQGNFNEFYFLGEFNHELSVKQVDLSIFGCLIPTELLTNNPIDKKSNIYFGNHWLNQISKKIDDAGEDEEYNKFDILGIPKILIETFYSEEFKSLSKEDKTKYFNLAKENVELEKIIE